MFQYEILSEDQAASERFQLLKEGEYDAVILQSIDKVSVSSGNPMMELTLQVFDKEGKTHDIKDYLVFTKGMMWRVIHFAQSACIIKEYEAGALCSETAINKRVRVKIVVDQGREIPQDKLKGKAPGSKYPDKNKVEDYVKREANSSPVPRDEDDPFSMDNIPFM